MTDFIIMLYIVSVSMIILGLCGFAFERAYVMASEKRRVNALREREQRIRRAAQAVANSAECRVYSCAFNRASFDSYFKKAC